MWFDIVLCLTFLYKMYTYPMHNMIYYTEINNSTHEKEELNETACPIQHSLPDVRYLY